MYRCQSHTNNSPYKICSKKGRLKIRSRGQTLHYLSRMTNPHLALSFLLSDSNCSVRPHRLLRWIRFRRRTCNVLPGIWKQSKRHRSNQQTRSIRQPLEYKVKQFQLFLKSLHYNKEILLYDKVSKPIHQLYIGVAVIFQ